MFRHMAVGPWWEVLLQAAEPERAAPGRRHYSDSATWPRRGSPRSTWIPSARYRRNWAG